MRTALEIKTQLADELGSHGLPYWRTLSDYLCAKISRQEFEDIVKQYLHVPRLVQLHNALLISIITNAGSHVPPSTMPMAGRAQRKRRRLRAYQGDEAEATASRSARLKQWALAAGKRERERVQALGYSEPVAEPHLRDEILQERGVHKVPEVTEGRAEMLHTVRLASTTRGITQQHLHERLSLASAQHGLSPHISKSVSSLMNLAVEAMLKKLVTHALAQTSSSRAITSIRPVAPPSSTLGVSAFDTVLTISPSVLPNLSAAATRMAMGEPDHADERDRTSWVIPRAPPKGGQAQPAPPRRDDLGFYDPRFQLASIIREHSGVREVINSSNVPTHR
ncbi:hypothetical protein EXIGLDRAFT_604916 [Exidia glandulosa HHB12029]|uniref:Transcriptional regulator of RNA polII, SAGA, subunit-domain-containing protein n=1 Tax=Exidia glandulosa HHB12029 TaxID=1314781 RepID=A0A165MYT5_EXIGL|nr:hypothetical protein EXIGLDRAFT_604916 [Exidia glandulosa HHB12029]